jgi:asparaginyl-tRNA synthetase
MTAIMKIRSTVFGAIHEYFRLKDFYEFQSPMFQPTQAEGGSTVFEVDYFGDKVYLAQTWQLYAEAAIFALEKIYTVAPSFRAERSKTSRHLTEYWHAEMESTWCSFEELQEYAEGLIKHIVNTVLRENKKELKILQRNVKKLETHKNPLTESTHE